MFELTISRWRWPNLEVVRYGYDSLKQHEKFLFYLTTPTCWSD
ncbi:hypothetical protein FHX03_005132 [Rhizobium sp. BK456]|nr:hypothetical protein [Rhizobium sp. BK456]